MEFRDLEEKKISSKSVFDGHLLHVKCDKVYMPNGNIKTREYFNHPGAACIVALTDDNEIIIERQFRYPFHTIITEIPAGKLDPEEDPLVAAKRELKEETGFVADEWTYLGDFYPSVAYTDEIIRMYLARGLHQEERCLDEDEFLNVERLPFNEFLKQIIAGEIKDGKTQAAVLKAAQLLKNKYLISI